MRCYRHPDRETAISCTRCGRPICPDCMRPASVGFQCPECVREGRATTRRPTLPYGGSVRSGAGNLFTKPWAVTAILVALNVAMYVFTVVTANGNLDNNQRSKYFTDLVLFPPYVAVNHDYYRLISNAFLHFGVLHIAVNMFSLIMLGPALERIFGRWRFTAIYLVSALGGSVAAYLWSNPLSSIGGASTAIFGLFGALVVMYRKLGLDVRALLPTIVINVVINLSIPNISWQGHLGGFVTGAAVAAIFVYTPRRNRLVLQSAGVVVVLAILVALTAYRTGQLNSIYG